MDGIMHGSDAGIMAGSIFRFEDEGDVTRGHAVLIGNRAGCLPSLRIRFEREGPYALPYDVMANMGKKGERRERGR